MTLTDSNPNSLKKFIKSTSIGGTVSINDLREKEFRGENLTQQEKIALGNFDSFRLNELNSVQEKDFHTKYMQLQIMANLSPYQEFLLEKYQKA